MTSSSIDQNAVCRQREAEVLTFFFFAGTGIRDKLFYDIKIHQRFAAEEIDFKLWRVPECSSRKSSACLPTSKDMRARSPWYLPWLAKQ